MSSEDRSFLVGIRCSTYNQSAYIIETMDGFAMQQTTFPFVAMIIDDASTDGEQSVLEEYLEKNFEAGERYETDHAYVSVARHRTNDNCTFAVLLLKENHYQKRLHHKKLEYLTRWRDVIRYEALCEGDDWWTDPHKLQKQVDFMESHPDYSMCCTSYASFRMSDGLVKDGSGVAKQISLSSLMKKNSIGTLTSLYRMDLYKDYQKYILPEISVYRIGDIPMWIYMAYRGKVYKLPDVTAMYRKLPSSASHNADFLKQYDFHVECTRIRLKMNELLGLRYGFMLRRRLFVGTYKFCRRWAKVHGGKRISLFRTALRHMGKNH